MDRGDDQGGSTLFSFIVATSVFALAFTSVTYFASNYIADHQADGDDLDAVAAAALAVLAGSPGAPSDWDTLWEADPDYEPDRLGLLQVGSETTMAGSKLSTLAAWRGETDKYVAARESLGLEDYELRIRSFPTFEATSDGVTGLDAEKVAYIGASAGLDTSLETTPLSSTGVDFDPAAVDADLADGFADGDVFPDVHATLNAQLVPRLHGFLGAHDGDQVSGVEAYWKVVDLPTYGGPYSSMDGDATRVLTMSGRTGGTWGYGSSLDLLHVTTPLDRLLLAEVDFAEGDIGDSVTIDLTDWMDGYASSPVANDVTDDYGRIEFYCAEGCVTPGWSATLVRLDNTTGATNADFATRHIDLTGGLVGLGQRGYLALTWHSYDDGHAGKGWFIRDVAVTTTVGGVGTTWTNDLDFAGSLYDALVVGSHVDQSNLNLSSDPAFDQALKAWIDAGGDILVTGNDDVETAWLDSLSAAVTGQATLSGTFYEDRTDTTHAVLNNPFNLHWTAYVPASKTYKPATNAFADVVHHRTEDAPAADESFLSVSSGEWGETYDGVAVITAFQPYAMGPVEAMRFYANVFVFQRFNVLEVDFGNNVPAGHDVGTAQRSVVLDARDSDLGWLEGQMVVHVWH